MIARQDRRHVSDLLVALLDQFFENLRAGAQARFHLSQGVAAIGLPNEKIRGALQQRQQSNEEEEQPTPEPAESKVQG